MTSDVFLENNWREVEGCEHVGPAQKEHQAGDGMPSYSYSRREAEAQPYRLEWAMEDNRHAV